MTTHSRSKLLFAVACRLLALTVLCLVATGSGTARAHPDLDEATRLISDLEFEASLASFEAALKSGSLTREELVVLLSERAFVFHALRRQDELIQDFLWLSALAPDHRLGLRAPPDLTATWTSVRDQGRGALKVALSAETRSAGSVDARASLMGTVPEGATPRLWLRRGQGAFSVLREPELHESNVRDAELAFYADALALGGVVISGEYSADNPLRVKTAQTTSPAPPDGERGWASRHKGWLIGGAIVVAAAVVVTAVLVARSDGGHNDKTNLKPMVTF